MVDDPSHSERAVIARLLRPMRNRLWVERHAPDKGYESCRADRVRVEDHLIRMESYPHSSGLPVRPVPPPVFADRRQYPRHPVLPPAGRRLHGAIQDISLGGVCLRVEEALCAGEAYRLVLAGGSGAEECTLRGTVMWCQGGRAGLQWCGLSGAQQRWLGEVFRGWRSEACAVRVGEEEIRLGLLVLSRVEDSSCDGERIS